MMTKDECADLQQAIDEAEDGFNKLVDKLRERVKAHVPPDIDMSVFDSPESMAFTKKITEILMTNMDEKNQMTLRALFSQSRDK